MSNQSPDQSLSQSPAPSKEMEETIELLAIGFTAEWNSHDAPKSLRAKLIAFGRSVAAELGKEREAKTAEFIETIALLHQQLSQKGEQADAFINQWSETNNALQRELSQVKVELTAEISELQKQLELTRAAL